MNQKRDITSSRTAGDIERKYGKRIVENEKELISKNQDISSLIIQVNELNNQIRQINQTCANLGVSVQEISLDLDSVEELSHSHENKRLLDRITEQNIKDLNNPFTGNYISLAQNIQLNQEIEGINDYNLILLKLNNLNRYIPCFKYGTSYKGINVTKDTTVDMEEISITVENEIVTNIVSTNNILEIIGIF